MVKFVNVRHSGDYRDVEGDGLFVGVKCILSLGRFVAIW